MSAAAIVCIFTSIVLICGFGFTFYYFTFQSNDNAHKQCTNTSIKTDTISPPTRPSPAPLQSNKDCTNHSDVCKQQHSHCHDNSNNSEKQPDMVQINKTKIPPIPEELDFSHSTRSQNRVHYRSTDGQHSHSQFNPSPSSSDSLLFNQPVHIDSTPIPFSDLMDRNDTEEGNEHTDDSNTHRSHCEEKQGHSIITRRLVTTTTFTTLNEAPVTITQTQTEEVSIPHSLSVNLNVNVNIAWSPFVQGLRFGVKEDKGKRTHMENSTSVVNMLLGADDDNDNDTLSMQRKYSFSLFDGHLGDQAAKFCTQHLHQYVARYLNDDDASSHDDSSASAASPPCPADECTEYLKYINNDDDTNDKLKDDNVAQAIRKAFHKTDRKFKKFAYDNRCEAGAVGVYVYYEYDIKSEDDDYVYIANVGDCRAILCSDGQMTELTVDHNPKNEQEKLRCGDCIEGDLLSNAISVTRAIGDFCQIRSEQDNAVYRHKKLDGLSCDPYIKKHKLSANDEFLIIACDGLWDVVSNQTAMQECRRSLRRDGDCEKAAEKLVNFAKRISNQASRTEGPELTSDNISVMVIGFANKDKNGNFYVGPQIPPRPAGSRLGRRRGLRTFKSI
eukprot:CAMPEP_0197079230 /NCGR_PEP_ID=MMETSP1384-20130603/213517_1 /TAXON_ID=29189 /ORGANISM="Ammonia sp." /LENGTH=611 /DNA_ID=CAMNT_0042518103 /DNA_START=197 /DNA_END=2032 /DNA_ORIENTATION=-